jgi:hypothetical protein
MNWTLLSFLPKDEKEDGLACPTSVPTCPEGHVRAWTGKATCPVSPPFVGRGYRKCHRGSRPWALRKRHKDRCSLK